MNTGEHPPCWRCDTDRHICPGCGDNVSHDEIACAECSTASRDELDQLRQGNPLDFSARKAAQ